ncbi:hypothetical protein GCM10010402_09380 [Actinomadura luteofluorescens]|uniref:DUF2807 domain-containing protein n=1 Tax=Actinomadura luteofluorescens TaxID=46163 RepID=UPI0021648306|nr:DUF2807 domain-containing protein [Actinomadura glauciflava]MCR3738486.1 protein of unknown function (DUF4098) [Actinomadura glauciflava]
MTATDAPDRPRRRAVWIALAAVTALAVVAPVGLTAFGRAVQRTSTSMTPYRHAIREVRLDVGSAEVSVGPGTDGEARVYKDLRWGPRKPELTESLVDDVLFVTFRCPGPGWPGAGCGAEIDIQVPAAARVSAVAGSGRIDVRGVTGDLDLRTGSGEIDVAGARGRLRLLARSGTINGRGLASPKTRADVSSGTLDLRYAEPPDAVDASAGSGTVKIIVPAGSRYRVAGWTGAGNAHLNPAVYDDRSSRLLSVRSGSGETYVDYRDD